MNCTVMLKWNMNHKELISSIKRKKSLLWLNFVSENVLNGPLSFCSGYQIFKPTSLFGSWKILANFHPCTITNQPTNTCIITLLIYKKMSLI